MDQTHLSFIQNDAYRRFRQVSLNWLCRHSLHWLHNIVASNVQLEDVTCSVCPHFNNCIWSFEWVFVFIRLFVSDHDLISKSLIVVDSSRVFMDYIFSVCACLHWHIYLQSAMWFIGRIVPRPKTSWTVLFPLVP